MVNVFVTGGSGYIGREICLALRRAGHAVTALVRTKDQGMALLKEEVKFVVGQMELKLNGEVFGPAVEQAAVIIDTTMPQGDPFAINAALREFVANFAKKSGQRKRYVYISGGAVYGDYPGQLVSEELPCNNPFMAGRINHERDTIAMTGLAEGVVVRPGFVYGASGGQFLLPFFATNSRGELEIVGNPNKMYSWVHVGDVAAAFVLVAEAPRWLVAGEIFNLSDDSRVTLRQIREAFVKHKTGKEVKVVQVPLPDVKVNWFSHAIEGHVVMSAAKIRRVLHWSPRHGPVLDELPLFYECMLAHNAFEKRT